MIGCGFFPLYIFILIITIIPIIMIIIVIIKCTLNQIVSNTNAYINGSSQGVVGNIKIIFNIYVYNVYTTHR